MKKKTSREKLLDTLKGYVDLIESGNLELIEVSVERHFTQSSFDNISTSSIPLDFYTVRFDIMDRRGLNI